MSIASSSSGYQTRFDCLAVGQSSEPSIELFEESSQCLAATEQDSNSPSGFSLRKSDFESGLSEREKGQLSVAHALSGDSLIGERVATCRQIGEFIGYKVLVMNNLDLMAENGGFEPPIELSPYNGLANRRLQPLGQLSVSVARARPMFLFVASPLAEAIITCG